MQVVKDQAQYVQLKARTGLEITVIDYSNKGVVIIFKEHGRIIVEELGTKLRVTVDKHLEV